MGTHEPKLRVPHMDIYIYIYDLKGRVQIMKKYCKEQNDSQ